MKTRFDKITESPDNLLDWHYQMNWCNTCEYYDTDYCGFDSNNEICKKGVKEWLNQPLPMNEQFTDKDIEYAEHYRMCGFNWIARSDIGLPEIFKDKPIRCNEGIMQGLWLRKETAHQVINKRLFQNIKWEDEPILLDDIINSKEKENAEN